MQLHWLASEPRGSSYLCLPPSTGVTDAYHSASFYVGMWDMNSGPPDCSASTSPTKLIPWPLYGRTSRKQKNVYPLPFVPKIVLLQMDLDGETA